jgi:four helix bundle protein
MANKLEELPIYAKVVEFWSAVNALLEKPLLRRNRDLHEQISRANDSIPANMTEGFEQGTDRAFANYVTHSKASLSEVLKRLKLAYFKHCVTADEVDPLLVRGEELGRCSADSSSIYVNPTGRIGALTARTGASRHVMRDPRIRG